MHDQPSPVGDRHVLTIAEKEAREKRRVLREVLGYYPSSFMLEELIRELSVGVPDFSDEDGRNAARDLTGCGLLHRLDDLVLPTRPAVVYYDLLQDGEI